MRIISPSISITPKSVVKLVLFVSLRSSNVRFPCRYCSILCTVNWVSAKQLPNIMLNHLDNTDFILILNAHSATANMKTSSRHRPNIFRPVTMFIWCVNALHCSFHTITFSSCDLYGYYYNTAVVSKSTGYISGSVRGCLVFGVPTKFNCKH